jgi:uracil-DNA glycosylase family 4
VSNLPLFHGEPRALVEVTESVEVMTDCQRCTLGDISREAVTASCIPAEGAPGGVLVVGEHAREADAEPGRPFCGATGAMVRKLVGAHWTGPVAYDYAVRCRPAGLADVGKKIANACRGHLAQTVREAAPTRIIALGPWAAFSLLGRKVDMHRAYGWLYGPPPVPVFCLPSPRAAGHNRLERKRFATDVAWALTCAAPDVPPWSRQVGIVTSGHQAELAATELCRGRFIAYDCETFGRMFSPEFRLLCVGVSSLTTTWVWPAEALADPGCRRVLEDLLTDVRIKKTAANFKFDSTAIRCGLGVEVRGFYGDTYLWPKLIDPDGPGDLESLAELVGMGGHKEEAYRYVDKAKRALNAWGKDAKAVPVVHEQAVVQVLDESVREAVRSGIDAESYAYGMVPRDVLQIYCGRDALSCALLTDHYESLMADEPSLARVWSRIVRPASQACEQIEAWGIGLDEDAVRAFGGRLRLLIDDAKVSLAQYEFNPDSPLQVAKLLYGKLGLHPKKLTDTGKPSTDADSLEALRGHHPVVDDLLTYRKLTKMLGTYADGMLPHVRPDGRVHPSFRIAGARSGRISCERPNMQNAPRAGTPDGKEFRDCFIAPPGRMLVEADFSQLELRIACMLSGDDEMLRLFTSGVDFHKETAKFIAPMVWGVRPDDVTDEHRSRTKTFVFGVIYGMSDAGIVARTGCSRQEAAAIRNAILGKFSKLASWVEDRVVEAHETGMTWTYWEGRRFRRRPLLGIGDEADLVRSEAERASYNTAVQGTASDYCLASLASLTDWCVRSRQGDKVVLTVHDSIMTECDEARVPEVAAHMRATMCSWDSGPVPLAVDVKVGQQWGSMSKLT